MVDRIGTIIAAIDHCKGNTLSRGELFIDREFLTRYFSSERGGYIEQLKIACESFGLDLIGIDIHDDSWESLMLRNEYRKLKDFFIVGLLDGPFNTMRKQKGFEEAMLDLKSDPSSYARVTSKLLEELKNLLSLFKENSFKGVALLDDIAGNQGLMMSHTDFENLIHPFYQSAVSMIKQNGLYAFFHSDGNIWNILEYILDAGFNCVHCVDSQAGMDLYKLKKVYGKKITLMGHIDLLAWDEKKIELEVEQAGKQFICGGLILGSSCGLSTLVPPSRIKALYQGWKFASMSI